MPTINYSIKVKEGASKKELVPVYVQFCAGRDKVYVMRSGLFVSPKRWSNDTRTIKQRIRTADEDKLIKNLNNLREHIDSEFKNHTGEYSKDWLSDVIYKYHNKKSADAKTLNDYISRYIADAESGDRKNRDAMNLAPGTVKAWKGFKRTFGEYQGIYTAKRIEWHRKNKKPLRTFKNVDFNGITIDFYNSFVKFLSDEGYNRGTIGRFIKELKMFMRKSLEDKLHNNREFEHSAFKGFHSKAFSIYLTKAEIDKLYDIDLSANPELDKARDAFLVLCETALRISDYKKVDVNIRPDEDGTKLIYITQTKTKGEIIIPCSARLGVILAKYDNQLPKLPEQYINRRIKIIARMCGIDEMLHWDVEKYGKRYEKTAHKWELITCHTGRRSACTNMYLSGIPSLSIMQISGHKTEEVFLKYIKVTPEQNARQLATHPYFSGLRVV